MTHDPLDFETACKTPSDINEYLELFKSLAETHETIVEMGVGFGRSTVAWIAGKPHKITCYDKKLIINQEHFQAICDPRTTLKFIEADTLDVGIEETDLLFIDTWHSATQLAEEFKLHASKVRRTIVIHDTRLYGSIGEDNQPGIDFAIHQFLIENPDWKLDQVYLHNNGLTILTKDHQL